MRVKTEVSLFAKIRQYRKLSQELQGHLLKCPNNWIKFQEIFNSTLDKIAQDIQQFEQDNIDKFEPRVYKLKKIFEKRYRSYFLYGDLAVRSFKKPYGYPGDFKIIDDIYQNKPSTSGFGRLWDNYFQQMAASKATRERKEDFKQIISDFVTKGQNQNIHIMNLASGPAREIKELLEVDTKDSFSKVIFDCYDFDDNAIEYAKQFLNNFSSVNFFKKNAARLALKKDIKKEISQDYDLIYSTGLFDYLDERIAVRLISNLKKLLKANGIIIISNYREKGSNSSAYLMEWAVEWNLIYRSEEEFRKLFIDAGFSSESIQIRAQKSKVMQYCFAGGV